MQKSLSSSSSFINTHYRQINIQKRALWKQSKVVHLNEQDMRDDFPNGSSLQLNGSVNTTSSNNSSWSEHLLWPVCNRRPSWPWVYHVCLARWQLHETSQLWCLQSGWLTAGERWRCRFVLFLPHPEQSARSAGQKISVISEFLLCVMDIWYGCFVKLSFKRLD